MQRYRRSGPALIGALLALTPMVFFVDAVVNSSALEISAGFAAFCSALCLAEQPEISPGLATGAGISFVALALARPISPLYLATVLVVAAVFAGWRRLSPLATQRAVQALGVCVVLAVAAAAGWLVASGEPSLLGGKVIPPLTIAQEMRKTVDLTWARLHQSIGVFGWLDTSTTVGIIVIWSVGVCALVVVALAVSRRARRAIPLLVAICVAIPLIFESPRIDAIGPYWQGRYWLPSWWASRSWPVGPCRRGARVAMPALHDRRHGARCGSWRR